jgi:TPR repeat protein
MYELLQSDSSVSGFWLRKAAEEGDSRAQYLVGLESFEHPFSLRPETFVGWLVKSAAQGYKPAIERLQIISMATGFDLSEYELTHLANDAVTNGDSAIRLSVFYEIVRFDQKTGISLLRRSAESTNARAQYELANRLLDMDTANCRQEAMDWLKKSAALGYKPSEESLKPIIFDLPMTLTDLELATLTASAPTNTAASLRLSLYFRDRGDIRTGMKWLRMAAESGDPGAQYSLGFYLIQIPEFRNYKEAKAWLRKSAAQGCKEAKEVLSDFRNIQREMK